MVVLMCGKLLVKSCEVSSIAVTWCLVYVDQAIMCFVEEVESKKLSSVLNAFPSKLVDHLCDVS